MYDLMRGPLVWIAFIALFAGFIVRYFGDRPKGDDAPAEPRSPLAWVSGWIAQRIEKGFGNFSLTVLFYLFLIITPLTLVGHRVLWEDAWGVAWPSLHAARSHGMALTALSLGGLLLLARFAAMKSDPLGAGDLFRWLVLISPLATGILASNQVADASILLPLHIGSGALWLALFPYTALADRILFFLQRGYRTKPPGEFRGSKVW